MPTVYVVEAQVLFAPALESIVARAGGRIVTRSDVLDLDDILASSPEIVVIDLDYTSYDVLAIIAALHAEAPLVRTIVLTGERRGGWLEACREAGAASVLAKVAREDELVHDLQVVFDGGSVWDRRAETARQ